MKKILELRGLEFDFDGDYLTIRDPFEGDYTELNIDDIKKLGNFVKDILYPPISRCQ